MAGSGRTTGAPTCLHLFSGPALRKDGLSAILRFVGWDVDDVDIGNSGLGPGPHDLASDHVWTELGQLVTSG
eukprot:2796327-Alexandrium_andersonii.AAC.1